MTFQIEHIGQRSSFGVKINIISHIYVRNEITLAYTRACIIQGYACEWLLQVSLSEEKLSRLYLLSILKNIEFGSRRHAADVSANW